MKKATSVPTLQQLISQRMKEKGLSRSKLVQELGYTNIAKGIRRLDYYLINLKAPNDTFITELLRILEIDGFSFHRSLISSQETQTAKRRAAFQPHVIIGIDFQPRPWFAAQFILLQRTISLNTTAHKGSLMEEIVNVISLYKHRINQLSYKGSITGFSYYRDYNYCLVFDEKCDLIDIRITQHQNQPEKTFGNRVIQVLYNRSEMRPHYEKFKRCS